MKRKEDLRVRKTKINLYNGLLKLMEEKQFEDIKVTDICNKALVNRSTFYDHFNDKYELFQSYIQYLGNILNEKLSVSIEIDNLNDYYKEFVKLLIEEIDSNYDIYKTILNNNYNSITINMLIDSSINSIFSYLVDNYMFEDLEYLRLGILFYVSGTVTLISDQFKNDKKFDKVKLTEFFNSLIPIFDKEKK